MYTEHRISSGPHLASFDSEPAAATSLGGRGRSAMGQGGHLGGVVLVPHVVIASVFGTPSRANPARNCQIRYEVSILAISGLISDIKQTKISCYNQHETSYNQSD